MISIYLLKLIFKIMVFPIATITKVIKYTVMLFLWLDNILLIIKYIIRYFCVLL